MRAAVGLLLVLGCALILVALWLFTWCVPLESACHMEGGDACVRLERTLRLAGALVAAGLTVVLAAILARRHRRRRTHG